MTVQGRPVTVQLYSHSIPAYKVVACNNQCIYRVPVCTTDEFKMCSRMGYMDKPVIVLHNGQTLCQDYEYNKEV